MIKFLIIIDESINYLSEVETALQQQRDTYKNNGVDIEYDIVRQDLSAVPWLTNIVSYSWINGETLTLRSTGNSAYSVVYIFDSSHWKAEGIGGWHMGSYNGYQIQLINSLRGNIRSNYLKLMMEGMHSWDTPIAKKLGISLSQYLGVFDYDETLVHGMYGQGQTLSQEESIRLFGEEYIKFDYSLLIKKIAPLLNKIFNPMVLTREQVELLYVLWDLDKDPAAIDFWTGKELSALLRVRFNDKCVIMNAEKNNPIIKSQI